MLLSRRLKKIRDIARLRNVGGYENMYGEQLENIFSTPPASIPS